MICCAGSVQYRPNPGSMCYMNICSNSKIVLSSEWKSERFPRFAALFSTRGGPFRLLLPLPCRSASTSPGEGLPGGLLEGSCGRRKRRSMPNRLKVGMYARLLLPFKLRKCSRLRSDVGEKYGLAEWRNRHRRARLLLRSQRERRPRAREEGVLDAGRIRLVSRRSCKRSTHATES